MLILPIDTKEYSKSTPFNHIVIDTPLSIELATQIQKEITDLDPSLFDRYHNPFEDKWTLRNKHKLPLLCNTLFNFLESDEFINDLSAKVGIQLIKDPTRNFCGIHTYDNGDKLDVHLDAGIHPVTKQKKELTLCLYLSKNWLAKYGCQLEIWKGTNGGETNPRLIECVTKIVPSFNKLVIFSCDDYSWHGNPTPSSNPPESKRILLTISYLSNRKIFKNKKQKAQFVKLPNEPYNLEKQRLRLLRSDPVKYKDVYRTDIKYKGII
jgi:hypothetical protein